MLQLYQTIPTDYLVFSDYLFFFAAPVLSCLHTVHEPVITLQWVDSAAMAAAPENDSRKECWVCEKKGEAAEPAVAAQSAKSLVAKYCECPVPKEYAHLACIAQLLPQCAVCESDFKVAKDNPYQPML